MLKTNLETQQVNYFDVQVAQEHFPFVCTRVVDTRNFFVGYHEPAVIGNCI